MNEAVIAAACALLIAAAVSAVISLFLRPCAAELSVSGGHMILKASKSLLPRRFRADITVTNLYTEESRTISGVRFSSSENAEIAISDTGCGVIRAEISSLKQAFRFSPFGKTIPCKETASFIVMPKERTGTVFSPEEKGGIKHAADGYFEGVREYRRGERFSDIHMKLSAKTGKYMLRERKPEDEGITISFTYEKAYAEENASALLGAVRECLMLGTSCCVVSGTERIQIEDTGSIVPGFGRLFASCRTAAPQTADYGITHGEVRKI